MRITVTATVAAIAGIFAPAAHAASFDPAVTVRGFAPRPATTPVSAVTDQGRTALAFVERRGRDAVVVAARGTLERPVVTRDEITRDGSEPAVACTPRGTTAVAWSRTGRRGRVSLHVRVGREGSPFGRTQRLAVEAAGGKPLEYQLVPFASDRFIAFWSVPGRGTADGPVRYAVSSASGRFGPARNLGRGSVRADIRGPGDVLAAVVTDEGRRLVRHTWRAGRPTYESAGPDMTPVTEGARFEAVTPTHGFGPVLAWREVGAGPLRLRTFAAWTPEDVFTVDAATLTRETAEGPAVGMPAGGALAAWSVVDRIPGEGEDAGRGTVFAATHIPGGGFPNAVQLSAADEIATSPSLGTTRGLGVIVWRTGRAPSYGVHYATRDVPGTFRPGRALSRSSVEGANIGWSQAGVLAAWVERRGGAAQSVKAAVLRDGWIDGG